MANYHEEFLTVGSVLCDQAAIRGSATAFITEGADGSRWSLSYRDIWQRAQRAAQLLAAHGVTAGDRVHVHLANRIEFVDCWFGCAVLGAVLVPTGLASSAEEIGYVREHSGSVLSVADQDDLDIITRNARGMRGRDPAAAVLAVGRSDWLAEVLPCAAPPTSPRSADRLAIMYTSGTTSRPKGVIVTHANYLRVGEAVAQHLRITPQDRWLVVLPLFHANAQFYSVMSALVSGASVALMPKFSASRWGAQVQLYQATLASLFAAPVRMILARPVPDIYSWDGLRVTLFAQNLKQAEADRFEASYRTRLLQLYGMTETIAPPLMNPLYGVSRHDSIGRPTLGTQVAVRREDGTTPSVGQVGELYVFGEPGISLMDGYLGDEAATTAALDQGWLRTGDRVRIDEHGFFYFVDRAKDMVKRAGENVALSEIERVINDLPFVLESAVVGVPDEMLDARIHAFVVRNPGQAGTAAQVLGRCRERLAKFKVPDSVTFLDSLPRTAVGKIQKRSLNVPDQTRQEIPMNENATVQRIDHVGVVVRDIEQSRTAYVKKLGLEPDGEELVESVSVRLAYLKCAGDSHPAWLQLVQPVGPGPVADFLAEHGEGLHHICFGVPNISDALQQIEGEAGTAAFRGGRGRTACFLGGRPGNVLIELTELGIPAQEPRDTAEVS
jgi:carnitine-CoA ligase